MKALDIIAERIDMLKGQFAMTFDRARISEAGYGPEDGVTKLLYLDAAVLNARLTELETLFQVVDNHATDR